MCKWWHGSVAVGQAVALVAKHLQRVLFVQCELVVYVLVLLELQIVGIGHVDLVAVERVLVGHE